MSPRPFLFLAALAASATAQDGGQLYATYCGACHGADGKGATGGQFPPLAGSEWVDGSAERSIKIVLHGLTGPVEISGKSFNLEMPPQGAALPDDQIAAILTHVRSSWGNKGGKVTPADVVAARKATASRDKPWTQEEILKLHPLPAPKTALRNLTSRIYHGSWQKLPDFTKLTATNVEEEHTGLISVKQADRTDDFGLVWEGEFIAEKKGNYTFRLGSDDGSRLVINGKEIARIDGIGPIGGNRDVEKKLTLNAGPNPIRIEYFEYKGQEGIALAWKGPGTKEWQNLSADASVPTPGKPGKKWPEIPIQPTPERAAIYRNFIAGTTPRAIGIGLPGGINLAYSADHLAPELVWTGAFMDGGHHWTGRGQGSEAPAGDTVVKLTGSMAYPEGARFRGYQLDPAGNPTFAVTLGELKVTDAYHASAGTLVRTLSAEGSTAPLTLLISEGNLLASDEANNWTIGANLSILSSAGKLTAENNRLTLHLTPGQSATLTYRWHSPAGN